MRNILTTTVLLALLTITACAQNVPIAPQKKVAAEQEKPKAQQPSAQWLPPDPNKFAVIISGISGEESYAAQFAKWTSDLRAAMIERLGFAEEHITVLSEKPAGSEQRCSAEVVRDTFVKLRNTAKPDHEVFIFFIGH